MTERAYAGPVRPATAPRDSVLCLPTDIQSLLVKTLLLLLLFLLCAVVLGVHLSVHCVSFEQTFLLLLLGPGVPPGRVSSLHCPSLSYSGHP